MRPGWLRETWTRQAGTGVMRILVLDGSGGEGAAALVDHGPGGSRLVLRVIEQGRGGATRLAAPLADALERQGWEIASIGLLAVVVGPGSFTGLRATLALAQGLSLGGTIALQGVTTGEALRHRLITAQPALPIWCVATARRDRVFLDRGDAYGSEAFMLDDLPCPEAPVLLAGDASALVAERVAAKGGVAIPSGLERADALAIAAVALERLAGRLAPLAALPLYVDPPEAKQPAAGLRPPPTGS